MNVRAVSIYSGFWVFAIVLLFLASTICSADEDEEPPPSPIGFHPPPDFGPPKDENAPRGPVNEQGQFSYIIRVDEIGMLEEQKRRDHLESGQRYNKDDPISVIYREQLSDQIDIYISMISQVLGREVVVTHRFLILEPGFSLWLFEEEVEAVENVPGIIEVEREFYEYPASYNSPRIQPRSATPLNG